MKKPTIIGLTCLASVAVLSGCGATNKTLTDEIFTQLQAGYRLEVEVKEQVDTTTNNFRIDTVSQEGRFSFKQYRDLTSNESVLHECYHALVDDDYLYATRLNVSNKLNYTQVYNPVSESFYRWDDGFTNVFDQLALTDLVKQKDGSYQLSETIKDAVEPYIITSLYGNPGLTLDNFSLSIDQDNTINILAEASFTGSTTYEYTFKAKVTESGDQVVADEVAIPFASVTDEAFATMLTNLKNYQWTATAINYADNTEVSRSTFLTDTDKAYYEYPDWDTGEKYQIGFYNVDATTYQEVEKDGDNFYRVGNPDEGNVQEIFPSFAIDRACFDLIDGTYHLKNRVEGEISHIYPLMVSLESLYNFTIKINSGEYIFENVQNNEKTVITFSNIGSTDVGFSAETVLDRPTSSGWGEILSTADYNYVAALIGSTHLDALPVPSGYATLDWVQFSEESDYAILLCSEEISTIADDISNYGQVLVDAGFAFIEGESLDGGTLYLSEDESFYLELNDYEGYFAVLIMPVEALA